MNELLVNLHIHSTYSDGSGTHAEIVDAALTAGLDVVITTDHNVFVNGLEGYYQKDERRVLLMIGEEIHDQTAEPQKNHLLAIGSSRELAEFAENPQQLIDGVLDAGGLAFIAHPIDPAAPAFGEPDISWVNWEVDNYTGIELWNGMSEFKSLLRDWFRAVFYAFNPKLVARGPLPATLAKWDQLLATGNKVVAIGGSDAHAFKVSIGPIRRILYPYLFHFGAVNTHIFVPQALVGDASQDSRMIIAALRQGHAFIGYDLPAATRGFRFSAQGEDESVIMGDEIVLKNGVTLQIYLPQRAECQLIKDGEVIKTWHKREICTYIATQTGVYRVEVYCRFQGRRRGWIFSNPIYVVEVD